jgi:hypothetical protein
MRADNQGSDIGYQAQYLTNDAVQGDPPARTNQRRAQDEQVKTAIPGLGLNFFWNGSGAYDRPGRDA